MSKTIFLVNAEMPEIRIAEIHDGRLFSLDIDRGGRLLGDIYQGRVENVLPGMDAAFVDIGLSRNALIYAGDVESPDVSFEKSSPTSIESLLRVGDTVTVQVSRPPVGSKGARVTTRLSLPGRYVVLSTNSDAVGVSRRIGSEEERSRLRRLAEKLRPLDHGLIIRTEAENILEADIARDIEQLVAQFQAIKNAAVRSPTPCLLHRDLGALGRLARDRLYNQVESVLIDSLEIYEAFRLIVQTVAPQLVDRIQFYEAAEPLFQAFSVELEIKRSLGRNVALPSGGGLVIDETEALTAIDVNTGKFVGKHRLAETVLQTNLEAVSEVARQVRLRDLGGMIVIDFIDMERTRDRVKVLNALEAALKDDRTKTRIVQISPSGLVEMTRRREGFSLRQLLYRPCPYCSGEGVVKTAATIGIQARRAVRELARRQSKENESAQVPLVQITLHPEAACAFLGDDAQLVQELENSACVQVEVRVDFSLHLEASRLIVLPDFTPGLAIGNRLELTSSALLYPQKAPVYAVIRDMLVLLEQEESELRPRLIEITKSERWFARAKVLAYYEVS